MTTPTAFQTLTLHPHLPEQLTLQAFLLRGEIAPDSGPGQPAPPEVDDAVKTAVRALLRWGGHKPSGRGRPASESLAKALEDGRWPTITPTVDLCNRLSLTSGLPISVLDAGKLQPPLQIRIGEPEEEYIFNPSGQVLSLKGLLLVADASGPTGGPVKDAQRSKVDPSTQDHLIVIWGSQQTPEANRLVRDGLESWSKAQGAELFSLQLQTA